VIVHFVDPQHTVILPIEQNHVGYFVHQRSHYIKVGAYRHVAGLGMPRTVWIVLSVPSVFLEVKKKGLQI
jgi:hypothetical protein